MKIYKYCDERGLSILKDLELRLSSPNSFNDPFEFSPRVNLSDYSKEQCIQALNQEHMFHEWCRQTNQSAKKEARDYYFSHLPEIAGEFMPNFPENLAREIAGFARRAAQWWAVGCFSKTNDSILMWSHYANKHQGMVIGFETEQEPFNNSKRVAILTVQYDLEKVTYKHPFGGGSKFEAAFHEVASRKFQEWEYEKEVRIIAPIGSLREKRFLRLSASAIESVILGCNSESALVAKVLDARTAPHFEHLKVYIAEQNRDAFMIKLKEVHRQRLKQRGAVQKDSLKP